MKVAVVGAGFAGLGACHYLVKAGHQVVLFDEKGVGAGASGVQRAMLHPHQTRQLISTSIPDTKLLPFAEESMALTKGLIERAQKFSDEEIVQSEGIVRKDFKEEDMLPGESWDSYDNGILLKDCVVVSTDAYLNGLLKSMPSVEFRKKKVIPGMCEDFDQIIWAIGASIDEFDHNFSIELVKGQSMIMKHPTKRWEYGVRDKGY